MFQKGLFVFRRDLRIVDNKGLELLQTHCNHIYTLFIFTPEQVTSANKYKSDNAVQFMIESLQDLSSQIRQQGGKIICLYGSNEKSIKDCIQALHIDVVCFNLDITPYARERDAKLIQLCENLQTYIMYDYDYYLHEPGSIVNGTGQPYQKFTPYYETCLKKKVDLPTQKKHLSLSTPGTHIHISNEITLEQALQRFTTPNSDILVHGGRTHAKQVLKTAVSTQTHYSTTHNNLAMQTTQLSAYIKFGCISIREAYQALHGKHDILRQLIWRDFYANIMYSFPHVLGHSLKEKYDALRWHHNSGWFQAWKKGETGFPVVDAGMRQLNTTGYMHNRARLIVASFLVKILLIDWREGEKYFASQLTDYDPASNNGNWQWISGGGADSQPYFRIFNPWEQTKKVDSECTYIKQWVPELREVPKKDILHWDTEWERFKQTKYPGPICHYVKQRDLALKMYKTIF